MLLSLAQTHNISHSAAMLNTTQPGLSKWLRDLEEDIGLQLFERHARGLFPTPYGEALIAHVRRIDAQIERAHDDMRALRASGGRQVVVGTSVEPIADTVPLAIILLLNRMPQVQVKLIEDITDHLLPQLTQGDVDIVVGRYAPEYYNPAILSEALYLEPIHLVARLQHPLFEQETVEWADVQRYRWIVWVKGTPVRKALEAALDMIGGHIPVDAVETNSIAAGLTLINDSDMIGVLSHRAALRAARTQIIRILPMRLPGFGSIAMYWQRETFQPDAVQAMLDCLRQTAAEQQEVDGQFTRPASATLAPAEALRDPTV